MIEKQKIKNTGFTLVELLVVIAIMVLLVLFYIPQYRQFARRNELKMAAQEMKEKILQVQSYALAPQHTKPDPEENFPFSYYRFVFYPDDPKGIRYEINMGSINYNDTTPTAEQLQNERTSIESGYLPKEISYVIGSGTLNTIDGEQQGNFIFKIPNGDCYYAWQPDRTGDKKYTFENQVNETVTIWIMLDSCKVTTEKE